MDFWKDQGRATIAGDRSLDEELHDVGGGRGGGGGGRLFGRRRRRRALIHSEEVRSTCCRRSGALFYLKLLEFIRNHEGYANDAPTDNDSTENPLAVT